jgi:hypothetical protein
MTGTTGTPMIEVVTKIDGYTIEQVEKLPVPVGKIGKIPITNQDSGYATENMPGRYDPGDTQLSGIWASGKTGLNKLISWQNDRTIHQFEVDLPDGTAIKFPGYLGTFTIIEQNERATYQIDVSVLGIPTYTTTRAALTTPFFTTSNSGVIAPAASATKYDYVINYLTGVESVTLTPTDATSGAVIYVNDTAVTSGQASGAITLGSATSITNATIRVVETGKADAYYFFKLVRA